MKRMSIKERKRENGMMSKAKVMKLVLNGKTSLKKKKME